MSRPIEDYALIGDLHSAALVGSDGSIDWLCLPRFDSAACFAALLGEDRHGHWRISPADGNFRVRRRYLADTLVLETEFGTDTGAARLIDCMPPRDKDPVLVRLIEGVSGTVDLRMTLEACFEYGSVRPRFRQHAGAHGILAGPEALWLFAPVHIRRSQGIATAALSVSQGDTVPLALVWRNSREDPPDPPLVPALIDRTERWWRRWAGSLACDGEWREAVIRSLITVKALTYAPTGARMAGLTGSRDPWDAGDLLGLLESIWREPDAGIWEVRGPRRQFVHSKVMVWAAANAAVQMIERFGDPGPADRWRRLRAEVRAEVLDRGYDAGARTFVQAYERPGTDASMLRLAQLGFLPPGDERLSDTASWVARELDRGGVLLRYVQDPGDSLDGPSPGNGCYLPGTFWLAQCLALTGRGPDARRVFTRLLELRNDVGLLSEGYDPLRGRLAGNYPLTASHIALAESAAALDSLNGHAALRSLPAAE